MVRWVPEEVKGALGVMLADRHQNYLAKAEEAERQAENAKDDRTRETWLKVAAGYRDLAHMAQYWRPERG